MVELLGWIGAIGLLIAFTLSSFGKMDNQGTVYHIINFACAGMLIYNAWMNQALPFVAINVFWVLVSTYTLIRLWMVPPKKATE